jgi:NADP-dependent 3-hydroxy acid dehydrogenase YdfG
MDLKGKAALITGATSGIGLAVAESLAKAGVRLVISGRRAELLAGHAKRLPDCVAIPGEISDAAFANDLFARAVAQTGGLDIVVNNAGRVATGPIDEIDIDTVCAMVRVNVEAAFRVAHLAVKHFRGRGSGHLINTGSVLGTKVRAQIGAYAGTKHAVEALSEALRLELAGSGIRITTVEPGLVTSRRRKACCPRSPSRSRRRTWRAAYYSRSTSRPTSTCRASCFCRATRRSEEMSR